MAAPSTQELDELMQAASHGDERAFRQFYDLSAPAILAFLLELLRDRFHAEDVLQDAIMKSCRIYFVVR